MAIKSVYTRGVNNGHKLRANSAHPGTHSAIGAAPHATGTPGVTSGPDQTQGLGAGGALANGVKGLGHRATHHRGMGYVSMYPMLQVGAWRCKHERACVCNPRSLIFARTHGIVNVQLNLSLEACLAFCMLRFDPHVLALNQTWLAVIVAITGI
eukprot:1157783-Pelagomonas_calceolata.AAC.1